MKRKLLFAALVAVLGSLNIYAQQTPEDGGVYYLYNTANGKFLTRGNNWGTQAVTNDFGSPWKVYLADGKYTLRMYDIVTADGNTNRALGTNGFSDNNTPAEHVAWTLTGDVNAYKLSFDDKYLCSPDTYGNNVINADANYNTTWQFLNVNEYRAVLAAKTAAQETAVAAAAEINISESTLATVVGDAEAFEATDMSSSVPFPTNSSWTRTGVPNRGGNQNQGSYGVECYQGGITYGYTVTGLVKGVYKVGIRAMFRSTNNETCYTIGQAGFDNSSAYLSANGNMVQIKDWYSSCTANDNPNSTDAFVTIANNGGYYSEVYTYVGDDGKLDLKAVSEAHWGANWFLFNGITLTYYRDKSADIVLPDNIELSQTSATLTTGSTLNLTATVTPVDALNKTVLWSSSDETVATVDGGFIIAQKSGTATITAKAEADETVTATCTITVADAAAPAFYSEISDGDFYIQNVATGMFLSGANDWGTHSSIIEHGTVYTAAKISEGVYTLDSHIYNNANDHFLAGDYTDGAATNLQIVALGDGKYSIANADGTAFFTAWPNSTYVTANASDANSSFAQWYFVSKKDRDKALTAATAVNPVDATYYIKNPQFSRNQSTQWNEANWTMVADNQSLSGGEDYNRCAESYHSEFTLSQVLNVPNGTYRFRAQGFYRQDGSDNNHLPVFYANNETVTFPLRTGTEGSMSAASASFRDGLYHSDWGEVTVTDRTLTIGAKLEGNTNLWCIFDNFELELIDYTPNTGVTASIDKDEIQIGQTATITASTDPASASFNAITSYTSSDEGVATVDANGVVRGVAVGSATITVTANEMENFSTTVDVTVTLVPPTAFTLSETEVALDKETTAATLTITPTPDGANDAANWTSSNESVATVVDGVVTAVSTGTATITATSVVDAEVNASATVTVSFPETVTPASYYENDDATRTVYTLGDNLIKNGTFEYPNGYYGWKNGADGDLAAANFDIVTDGENKYLRAKSSQGAGNANSISTGWPIEAGKTYVFGYKVKATAGGNSQYHVVSMTNSIGTESSKVSDDATPVTTSWTDVKYQFTNPAVDGYAFVQFRARWLANSTSFDDFYLCEITNTEEVGNVQYALDAIPTANIGTGAFQYSQDAIDNANALVQGVATVEDVENAYDALTTLNAPAAGKLYNVVNVSDGYNHNGKAVTFKSASNADLSGNTTSFGYNENPGSIYPQGFKFTAVGGVKNGYKLSYTRADGYEVFVGTGSSTGLGSNNDQIRPTTDASKAVTVQVVATTTENVWNLYNTLASKNIGANGANDQGFYTVASYNSMKIQEAVNNEVSLNIAAANQYGTLILPFNANVPDGVTAYSVSTTSGATLELNEEDAFVSNTPYIVFAESGASSDLAGLGAAYTDAVYTEGLLTGVYAATPAPKGSYVLQNNDDKVGFYLVNTVQPTVGANRCYLTVPAGVKANAFFFNEATGIQNVLENLQAGEIYDISGRKLGKLQKGVNIVNGKKVLVK